MFAVDDPLNQPMADMYGVVMGTRYCTSFRSFALITHLRVLFPVTMSL
jgi:hypothetical protein